MASVTAPQLSLCKRIYNCTRCLYFWRRVVEGDSELVELYSFLKEYFDVGLAFGCIKCKDRTELEQIMLGKAVCLIKRKETYCEKDACRNGNCVGGRAVHDRSERPGNTRRPK